MLERPADSPDSPRRGDDANEAPGEGAEAYGGDPDAEPSVTPEEVTRGGRRDQAEG
ncbi:MAG: hypothetical protein JO168_18635 [Solirubrobacterales bacterium]|nr:hypothetical protein [Solirubrobacterales bacterium]MBV9715766.1 hypothetical protein [Solirubrobacterales bacterium]